MNWKKLNSNTVFFLQVLIVFLLIAESSVSIPFWLQPLGRMHPLILHFPVVLVLLIFILFLFRSRMEENTYLKIRLLLVHCTALVTSLTVVFGFFLSMEDGYSGDLLDLHKWTGVGLSFMVYGLLLSLESPLYFKLLSGTSALLVVITGHLGANLTHGEEFLFEPVLARFQPEFSESTPIYQSVIQPVLESKCYSCHNPQKHKGDLDMSNWEALAKGGESGPVWVEGNPEESDMIQRIRLELTHDDHMPPDGKPQLSPAEIEILSRWVGVGPDNTTTLADLGPTDSLYALAANRLNAQAKQVSQKSYAFRAAPEEVVESLNSPFRTVRQVTRSSPALDAHIFVRQAYQPTFLEELTDVRDQVVNLNLSYLPVTDDQLKIVSQFKNLEKLILNYTDIGTEGIRNLGMLENLLTLAVVGTEVDASLDEVISNFKSLKELHLWETDISEDEIKQLQSDYPDLVVDEGYVPSKDLSLVIAPPTIKNKTTVLKPEEKIELEHKIPDTDIYYSVDGSDPDSTSTRYTGPFMLEAAATVKTVAYKKGWQPSSVNSFTFFMRGFVPAKITLLEPANQKYKGKGELSLTDGLKGKITQFTTSDWLGFQETDFNALTDFGAKPPSINKIVISYGKNSQNYIMKPTRVELYGGNNPGNLQLIHRQNLPVDETYGVNEELSLDIPAKGNSYRYYRIVAKPIQSLPEWHVGKGSPGWVFVDELFFY